MLQLRAVPKARGRLGGLTSKLELPKNHLSRLNNTRGLGIFMLALTDSIGILNLLFNSAGADYTEVLITQRDALESKFELIEVKKRQLQAFVSLYRALGGGWV